MQVVLFVSIGWPCGRRLLDDQEVFVYAQLLTEWPRGRLSFGKLSIARHLSALLEIGKI